MNTSEPEEDYANGDQSLKVIKEMIAVSRNKLNKDGILFIVWGWAACLGSLKGYITRSIPMTYDMTTFMNYAGIVVFVGVLLFTLYYLWKDSKKVQTYIGISLRYVWISLVLSMMLVNLIQANVLHSINFELQHPLFMVLMAFAVTVTGGILRHRLIIFGGFVFGALALTASYLGLKEQLLVESVAWAVAFVVPGHILFAKRKKVTKNV